MEIRLLLEKAALMNENVKLNFMVSEGWSRKISGEQYLRDYLP